LTLFLPPVAAGNCRISVCCGLARRIVKREHRIVDYLTAMKHIDTWSV